MAIYDGMRQLTFLEVSHKFNDHKVSLLNLSTRAYRYIILQIANDSNTSFSDLYNEVMKIDKFKMKVEKKSAGSLKELNNKFPFLNDLCKVLDEKDLKPGRDWAFTGSLAMYLWNIFLNENKEKIRIPGDIDILTTQDSFDKIIVLFRYKGCYCEKNGYGRDQYCKIKG